MSAAEARAARLERLRRQLDPWPGSLLPNAIIKDHKAFGGILTDGALMTFWFIHLWSRGRGWMFAATTTLADRRGITDRAMRGHLAALKKTGWVTDVKRSWRGRQIDALSVNNAPFCENSKIGAAEKGFRGSGNRIPVERNSVSAEVHSIEEVKGEEGSTPESASQTSGNLLSEKKIHAARDEAETEAETGEAAGAEGDDLSENDLASARRLANGNLVAEPGFGSPRRPDAIVTPPPPPPDTGRVWPPKDGADVHAKWLSEMSAAFPEFPRTRTNAKDNTICKKLLEKFEDPDHLEAIIRVAVWDWAAIRETVETWYTKDKRTPTPQAILKLSDQLAALITRGATSRTHRVSAYWTKFVRPNQPAPAGPTHGVNYDSPAFQVARANEARRKAAAERRRLEAEERAKPRPVTRHG